MCTADMKLGAMEGGQPAVLPSVTKKADFGSVEFLEQTENRRAVKVRQPPSCACNWLTVCAAACHPSDTDALHVGSMVPQG